MSLTPRNDASSVPKPRKNRRKIWRVGLICLTGLVMAGALLWFQREVLIKWYIQDALVEQGIDVDFSISSLSPSQAHIDNIHLSSDGKQVFSASTVHVTYDWREALKGQVRKVTIQRPRASLRIDEHGKLIHPSLPERDKSSGRDVPFPSEGVMINKGVVAVATPFGTLRGDVDVKALAMDDIQAQVKVHDTYIAHTKFQGSVFGDYAVTLKNNALQVVSETSLPAWQYETFCGTDLNLSANFDLDLTSKRLTVNEPGKATFSGLRSPQFSMGSGQVLWNGRAEGAYSGDPKDYNFDGAWTADLSDLSVTDDARRRSLAGTLTLNRSLSGISATAPFAPGLTQTIEQVLRRADLKGAGTLAASPLGTSLSLTAPLDIIGETQTINITPAVQTPLYKFDPRQNRLTLEFNADMEGAYAAKLTNAQLGATSFTGRDFAGVTDFKADLHTKKTWRARTDDGRPVRLAPLKARVNYENKGETRHVTMSGALNYDGDIPGGYVKGLTTRGEMRLRLKEDALTAWFTPARGARLLIDEMDTVSDWIATNIDLQIQSNAPIYRRNTARGHIKTNLLDGSGTLAHRDREMDLTFDFTAAALTGTMERKSGETVKQVWDIAATNAHMVSDTIPALGTDIRAPELAMTATLAPGQPLYFTAESSAVDVQTPQMIATNLNISAAGTSENLRADYDSGEITFSAMPLPPMPLQGHATYAQGAWTGEALTHLARAKETPIDVSYRFENGVGSAKVNVIDLPFRPGGLQPKHILPAFGGKVAQVKGLVSAEIDLGFGGGAALTSSARTTLKNMSMGTLPGPIEGLNAELTFSSLYPPATEGRQTVYLGRFDPGLPLKDGEVSFEIIPDGIEIHSAHWPLGDGFVSLDPTAWRYTAPENRMTLRVENIGLEEFLQGKGGENFKVTGDVTGVLPVVISGVSVLVENGVLAVKDGGVIQYKSRPTDAAAATSEVAGFAFDALKNFEYKSLEARLNGPLDGDLELRMVFSGRNEEVLGGAEFLFNVGIEGQLFNIAQSLQTGSGISATVRDEIVKRGQ